MNNSELTNVFTDIYFKTMKSMTTLLQAATTEFKVSFEQYQIMRDIAHRQATSLTDLVARRGVTKPAIARQLRILRTEGYVSQDISPDDRRKHILRLTEKGASVEHHVETHLHASFDNLITKAGRDNLTELTRILKYMDEKVLTPQRRQS